MIKINNRHEYESAYKTYNELNEKILEIEPSVSWALFIRYLDRIDDYISFLNSSLNDELISLDNQSSYDYRQRIIDEILKITRIESDAAFYIDTYFERYSIHSDTESHLRNIVSNLFSEFCRNTIKDINYDGKTYTYDFSSIEDHETLIKNLTILHDKLDEVLIEYVNLVNGEPHNTRKFFNWDKDSSSYWEPKKE